MFGRLYATLSVFPRRHPPRTVSGRDDQPGRRGVLFGAQPAPLLARCRLRAGRGRGGRQRRPLHRSDPTRRGSVFAEQFRVAAVRAQSAGSGGAGTTVCVVAGQRHVTSVRFS